MAVADMPQEGIGVLRLQVIGRKRPFVFRSA